MSKAPPMLTNSVTRCMLQREVRRMIASETATCSRQFRRCVAGANERHHLIHQVVVVLFVPLGALRRMDGFVIPALGVHRIDAECLYLPAFVLLPDDADHVPILVIEEAAHRGGKYNDR